MGSTAKMYSIALCIICIEMMVSHLLRLLSLRLASCTSRPLLANCLHTHTYVIYVYKHGHTHTNTHINTLACIHKHIHAYSTVLATHLSVRSLCGGASSLLSHTLPRLSPGLCLDFAPLLSNLSGNKVLARLCPLARLV